MADLDIPVPDELREALSAPKCIDLGLPEPKKITVTLPSGAALSSMANAGQNIPNDCSLTFSLMMQLQPLMGSMACVLKILKLLKPLSDAVTSPPPTPGLIKEIAEAVADLAPCFLMLTPAGMVPFIRDILCLIIKVLNCLLGQLRTSIDVMDGITVKLEKAQSNSNPDPELIASLECAQQNVLTSVGHLMNGIEPVQAILDLAEPFMSIAGIQAIQLPALGSSDSTEALNKVVTTLEEVVGTVQQIIDSVGGCPE